MNALSRVYQWQVDAGNTQQGYDDFLESAFQIEEALEGHNTQQLLRTYDLDAYSDSPKDISRCLMETCVQKLSDVERLDKALDSIVYAVGSIAKLGLNIAQLQEALLVVNEANQAKLGCERDEHGKLMKPDNFPNPEPRLQEILDRR